LAGISTKVINSSGVV